MTLRKVLFHRVAYKVFIIVLLFFLIYPPLSLARNVLAIKGSLRTISKSLKEGDLTAAEEILSADKRRLKLARRALNLMPYLQIMPVLKQQTAVLDFLLVQAEEILSVADDLFGLAKEVLALPAGEVDLMTISLDEARIIVGLADKESKFKELSARVDKIKQNLTSFDVSNGWSELKSAHSLFLLYSEKVSNSLDKASTASRLLPQLAGYYSSRTYLFVFQNNTEMRPAGGFLGSYGILKLKEGEIEEFFTDDTYNLDKNFTQIITPPEPLAIYNQDKEWTFRDANWSPDFPTSSRKMLEFYRLEGGLDWQQVDAVIALTPTVIEDLLQVLGPQRVSGYDYEFTSSNFTDQLELHVEKTYKQIGESKEDRKSIIGKLGQQLIAKMFALPPAKLIEVLFLTEQNLEKKQILLYSLNPKEQADLIAEGWAGEIKNTDADFLMVADANIASLKTDLAISRYLDYRVVEAKQQLSAKLKVTYDHQGKFDWKTTRYRTWVRVYVPLGSNLLKIKGNESEVVTTTELNKTVFGFFKSIEPGTKEGFEIEYLLPAGLNRDNYSLYFQKQAGIINYDLTTNLFGEVNNYNLSKDAVIR